MKLTAQEAKAKADRHTESLPSIYLSETRGKINSAAEFGGMRTKHSVPNEYAEFCAEKLRGDGFTVGTHPGSFTTLLDVSWEGVAPGWPENEKGPLLQPLTNTKTMEGKDKAIKDLQSHLRAMEEALRSALKVMEDESKFQGRDGFCPHRHEAEGMAKSALGIKEVSDAFNRGYDLAKEEVQS